MGLTHVTVTVRNIRDPSRAYSALFLIETGVCDSLIPAEGAAALGLEPAGVAECELANGTPQKFPFAICQIEFVGEITGGRVLFGPSGVEPILGVTALQSVGISVDTRTDTLKRLPAIPLKGTPRNFIVEIRIGANPRPRIAGLFGVSPPRGTGLGLGRSATLRAHAYGGCHPLVQPRRRATRVSTRMSEEACRRS